MRHAFFVAASVAAVVAVVGAACKEREVRDVSVTLGVAGRGSQGFACFEEPSADCVAFTQCTSTRRAAEIAPCVQAHCADGGGAECRALEQCATDRESVADCARARCAAARPPLIERARTDGGTIAMHAIVDLVSLGGYPGCRTSELSAWCTSGHECKPSRRRCMPITIDGTSSDPAEISAQIPSAFGSGVVLDEDAPDEPVVIRVVGVAKEGDCTPEEMDPRAPLAMPLVGCAYSCPVLLTSVSGPVLVDVDVFRTTCSVTLVEGCAVFFRDGGT